ncbi:MAG: hypothetical protein QXQ57_05495 [Sulfolobales archaeon]
MAMLRVVGSYFDGLSRILILEGGSVRLYMIDHYEILSSRPRRELCSEVLEVGEAMLCYLELGGSCRVLILVVGERAEIISLRLLTTIEGDPAGGSPKAAREHCIKMLHSII